MYIIKKRFDEWFINIDVNFYQLSKGLMTSEQSRSKFTGGERGPDYYCITIL